MSNQSYLRGLSYVAIFVCVLYAGDIWRDTMLPDPRDTASGLVKILIPTPQVPHFEMAAVEAYAQQRIQWFDLADGRCLYVTPADGWTITKTDLGLSLSGPCP